MSVKTFRPLTPSRRYITIADFGDITKSKPEKALVEIRKKSGGRNSYGRVTARGIGGGHKQKIRKVDSRRSKHGIEGTVIAVEYDPLRSARLALVRYPDGEQRYIIAPQGLLTGARLMSGLGAVPDIGNALPLRLIPISTMVHNVEFTIGRGGQAVRSAGSSAVIMSRGEGYVQLKLPSGEIRRVHQECYATIGQVGNCDHEKVSLGKAGRSRHAGYRPVSRGVARNPVDHPNGGGAGKSKSGGGWQQLTSPWGLLAKGYRTRDSKKSSDKFIVLRRDGRPMRKK